MGRSHFQFELNYNTMQFTKSDTNLRLKSLYELTRRRGAHIFNTRLICKLKRFSKKNIPNVFF